MENLKLKKLPHQKLKQKKIVFNAKSVLSFSAVCLMSFILGQGSVLGSLYPFGFALIMSAGGMYSLSAFIGTSIASAFSHSGILLVRYIVCAATLYLLRTRLFTPKSKFGGMWFLQTGTAFLVCSLTAIAAVLPQRGGFAEISAFLLEALFSVLASVFYRKSISTVFKKEEKFFQSVEMPYLYICFATLIASIADFRLFTLFPSVILSVFAIITMSYLMSETGGGLCAVICAAALAAAAPDGYNILPLAVSGVIAGLFSPLGKIITSLSFLLSFSTISLFLQEEYTFESILSALIPCLIFIIIPEKVYKKLRIRFKEKQISSRENAYRQDVCTKLNSTADAITAVSDGMNKVSENLKKIDTNLDRSIFCRVKEEVCNECENRDICWRDSFQHTLKGFEELTLNYRKDKPFVSTAFGKLFLSKCRNPKLLQQSLNKNLKRYDEAVREEIRQSEKRMIFDDQMKCTCELLRDFSKTFSKCTLVDNELSSRVKDIFNSFSVRCTKALCIIDTDGNMTVRAYCKTIDTAVDRKSLKKQIEEVSLRKFSEPEVEFSDTGTVVVLKQKPWMQIRIGKIQLSSEDSPICGDCLRELSDQYGNRTLILSDGMGTGGRAAVDAALCAEYLGSLIQSSVSFDNALRLVNSMLDLKSVNESLATIDVARFNLFSGKVEFFKAGAAVSFVRKNGKCSVIESVSLPAGILRDVSFAKEKVMLSKGDIVVMVSDGVTAYSTDWIVQEIEAFSSANPDILAQKIAGAVCDKSRADKRDDITVVVGIMTA